MRIKTIEQANGVAYSTTITSRNGVKTTICVLFPAGLAPKFIGAFGPTTIIAPERFGKWGTARERRAYVTKYAKEVESSILLVNEA